MADDEWDVEGIVGMVFKLARLDPCEVHGTVKIANGLFGPGGVVEKPSALVPGDALLAPRHGLRFDWPNPQNPKHFQVWLRRHISATRKRWGTGHEIGEWGLERDDYRGADREAYCEAISAALCMPRKPFRAYCRTAIGDDGPDFAEIAEHFGVTETAAALRFGEVTGQPVAVVTWHDVRQRGEAFEFGGHAQLVRVAFCGATIARLSRVELDGGRRVAVLAY
jgi:hypothetical protein